MGVEELAPKDALVMNGEAVAALGWAMQQSFGSHEVIIVGRGAAFEAMVALDGLRGLPEAAATDVASRIDVTVACAVADQIFAILFEPPKERFREIWGGSEPIVEGTRDATTYRTTSYRTDAD